MAGESTRSFRDAIPSAPTRHSTPEIAPQQSKDSGCILLLGSGPSHPSLLTLATRCALRTDLVLTDKLVPEGVVHVNVRITS
jgi:uroporphyrin-III C-methyltransferase